MVDHPGQEGIIAATARLGRPQNVLAAATSGGVQGDAGSMLPFLLMRHPWNKARLHEPFWPKARAVLEGMNTEHEKKHYLVTGEVEKDTHFKLRLKLSEFDGDASSILARLVSAAFEDQPAVELEKTTTPDGAEDAETTDLAEFESNVDGKTTSLWRFLNTQAPDALGVGMSMLLIWAPRRDESLAPASDRPGQRAQGLLNLRITPFKAEHVRDWDEEEDGRTKWVLLENHTTSRDGIDGKRVRKVQLLWFDQIQFRTWDVVLKDTSTGFNTETDVESINETTPSPNLHGCGCVPVVPFYGQIPRGLFRAVSPLEGSIRQDVAGFNADSKATFAEWAHLSPKLVIKTDRSIDEVSLDSGTAYKISAEGSEDVSYAQTDSSAFEHARNVIEARHLGSHRQAGADASGLYFGSATPESGRAKVIRGRGVEQRILKAFAKQVEAAHRGVLEIASRLMSADTPNPESVVFEGSVNYVKEFDLEEGDELTETYQATGRFVLEPTWHRQMLKRLALQTVGETSTEVRRQITDFYDDMTEKEFKVHMAEIRADLMPEADEDPPEQAGENLEDSD